MCKNTIIHRRTGWNVKEKTRNSYILHKIYVLKYLPKMGWKFCYICCVAAGKMGCYNRGNDKTIFSFLVSLTENRRLRTWKKEL